MVKHNFKKMRSFGSISGVFADDGRGYFLFPTGKISSIFRTAIKNPKHSLHKPKRLKDPE